MKYEITADLLTGNSLIDSEHKQLFEAVNRLLDVFSSKDRSGRDEIMSAATFLVNYVNKHFEHEEELQKKSGWREYDIHLRFHEDYKKNLRKIVDDIPKEGPKIENVSELNVHIVRLITHIRTMDKRLGGFLKEQG